MSQTNEEKIAALEVALDWLVEDYLNASETDYDESLQEIKDATGYDAAKFWWTKERLLAKLGTAFTEDEIKRLKELL